jgi:predicted RNA-binding Zn-ribbon protein involved in translation (DUF1610 family)
MTNLPPPIALTSDSIYPCPHCGAVLYEQIQGMLSQHIYDYGGLPLNDFKIGNMECPECGKAISMQITQIQVAVDFIPQEDAQNE